MADLLTGAEFGEWRSAINDAVDTFFKFTVTHCGHGGTFDRWSEENPSVTVTKTNLKCLVEFDLRDEIEREKQGADDEQMLKVTFGIDYLKSVNMLDPDTKEGKFNIAKDYFLYEGRKYRFLSMALEGPIDTENALLVITLEREEINA